MPENSAPETQGRGGWCWYFPRIWRRSKKFVAVLWMRMVYWSGLGTGSGRSVMVRSRGPLKVCVRWRGVVGVWRAVTYGDVLLDLDATHGGLFCLVGEMERLLVGGKQSTARCEVKQDMGSG